MGLAFGTLLLSKTVLAGPLPDAKPQQVGFYARLGLAFGYSVGDYRYTGQSLGGYGPQRELSFESTLHGILFNIDGALGGSITPGLVLAGQAGFTWRSLEQTSRLGYTTITGNVDPFWFGILVVGYPGRNLELFGGPAFAQTIFVGSGLDIGAADNIVELEFVSGFRFHAGIGYELREWFLLSACAAIGFLRGAHSRYIPADFTLEVAFQSF